MVGKQKVSRWDVGRYARKRESRVGALSSKVPGRHKTDAKRHPGSARFRRNKHLMVVSNGDISYAFKAILAHLRLYFILGRVLLSIYHAMMDGRLRYLHLILPLENHNLTSDRFTLQSSKFVSHKPFLVPMSSAKPNQVLVRQLSSS